MGTKDLRDFGPSHEFVNSEKLEELRIEGDLGVARIFVDTVEEI